MLRCCTIIILMIFTFSCNNAILKNRQSPNEFTQFENDEDIEIKYFNLKNEDEVNYQDWNRNYFDCPKDSMNYYTSKFWVKYAGIKKFITKEDVYRNIKNRQIIYQEVNFKNWKKLKRTLKLTCKKYFYPDTSIIFTFDTLPSAWLKKRNQLVLDSLKFHVKEGWYIDGTAQLSILREDFPKSYPKEISKELFMKIAHDWITKDEMIGEILENTLPE